MSAPRTVSIRMEVEDASQTRSNLEAIGAAGDQALSKIAQASQRAVAALSGVADASDAYARRAADIAAYGASLDRLQASFNPLVAAQRSYESSLAEIAQAERVGAIAAGEAVAARQRAFVGYEQQVAANATLAASYGQLGVAITKLVDVQQAANRGAGVTAPLAGDAFAARAADVAAYGAELDRLRAKFDPVFAVSKRYEATLEEIAQAERVGAINAATAARARDEATRSFSASVSPINAVGSATAALGARTGATAMAMRNLGIQSIDVFQQLASGAPIMMTLIQQGGQVGQMAAVTGTSLGAMAKSAAMAVLAINPLILVGVGVTAAVVGIGVAAESGARQVQGLAVRLRASRDDYDAVARDIVAASKAIAASTGFSGADARAAGLAIGNSPGFRGAAGEMEALIRTAGDLAAVMGKTMPEAASDLAQALADPAAAAKRLADQSFPGMSQSMAYSIKRMADAGDQAGAQARQLDVLRSGIRGASDAHTPLQKAVRDLGNAFTEAGQGGRSFAEQIGMPIVNAATRTVNGIRDVITTITDLKQSLTGFIPQSLLDTIKWLQDHDPTLMAYNALKGSVAAPAPLQAHPSISHAIQSSASVNGIDPVLLGRLQATEGLFDPATGTWKTSSTGRVGPMQIAPDTFAGVVRQFQTASGLTDINNPAQNVAAGAALLGHLLRKYGDVTLAVLAYHEGEPKVDRILAGGGSVSASQDALDQARRIVSGYGGTGLVAGTAPGVVRPSVAASSFRSAEDASTSRHAADVQSLRDQAFQAWVGSGTLSAQRDQNRDRQGLFRSALSATTDPDEIRRYTEALAELRGQESDLVTEQERMARSAVDATKALAQQEGYARRMAEIDQQFAEAARKAGTAVDAKALAMAKASEQTKLATDFEDMVRATDKTTEAQRRVAAAYDGTAESVQRATNYETALAAARKKYDENSPEFIKHVREYADSLDRGTEEALRFQQQQSSVNALFNTLGTTVDRIGQGLVDAALSGARGFANMANVGRAALASIATEIARLGLINPTLNFAFGGARDTLGAALSALGNSSQSGAPGSGGGGILSGLGNALSLGRISDAFGFTNFGSQLSQAGEWLGLTGQGGLLSGISEGISSLLSTGINGVSLSSATNSALGGAGGVFGPAPPSAVLGAQGGATIGGLLGGFGLGFGAGSLGGGLLQWALGKTGPAPTIGAGLGAAGGALAGTFIFPGLGTIAGGLIGGLLGGGIGGFIGPGKKNAFSATGVTLGDDGLLAVGKTVSQIVDTAEEVSRLNQQVAAINQFMSANELRIVNTTSQDEFGQTRINGANSNVWMNIGQSSGASSDLFSAFNELRFSAANDDRLNGLISGRSFAGPDQLADFTTFVNDTMTALEKAPVSEYAASLKALNDVYDAAIAKAKEYTVAEGGLVAERDRRLADINARRDLQSSGITAGLQVRYLQATGKNEEAAILAFDTSAAQQRMQLTDQILALGLDGTEYAAERLVQIERTLAAERIAIQEQYADRSRQMANSILGGLTYGGLSPLAPEQKYFASLTALNQARQALTEGGSVADFASVAQQVLPVARDFLGTSERYAALVADVATAVASSGGDPAGLSSLLQAQVEGTDALKDVFSRYGEQQYSVANATLSEIKRLASAIEALMARSVAA